MRRAGTIVWLGLLSVPFGAEAAEIALSFGDAPGGASGGYRIERREAGAQGFEAIALVGPGVPDFVDRDVAAATCTAPDWLTWNLLGLAIWRDEVLTNVALALPSSTRVFSPPSSGRC